MRQDENTKTSFFSKIRDTKIKTEEEIEELVRLPVLASIPEKNFKRGKGKGGNEKGSHSL